jgi:hypothetical protein
MVVSKKHNSFALVLSRVRVSPSQGEPVGRSMKEGGGIPTVRVDDDKSIWSDTCLLGNRDYWAVPCASAFNYPSFLVTGLP